VLSHDSTLERLSGRDLAIHRLSADALAALPLCEPERFGDRFAGERFATLRVVADLLAARAGLTAFIELKREGLSFLGAARALDAVAAVLPPGAVRAIPISFDYGAMALAREHGWPQVGIVLEQWADARAPQVARLAPDYVFCDRERIPADADLAGLPGRSVIYEVGDARTARALLARGAAMLETFDIGGLLAAGG
jgi:glycerophosphoryl diester phosphodiesterase